MSTDINGMNNNGEFDIFVVKYDKDGNLLWQKSWGGNDTEYAWRMKVSSKNEYILVGNTYSTDIDGLDNKGHRDSIIIKYDDNGNILNLYHFGFSGDDNLNSISLFENDDIFVSGAFNSDDISYIEFKGNYDAVSHLYNEDGLVHSVGFGSTGMEYFLGNYINKNDIFAVGRYNSSDIKDMELFGSQDAMILKYFFKYNFNTSEVLNGEFDVIQKEQSGIVTPTPNDGYELDKIIVKNSKDELVEVTALEDGTYSFELNDDVSVEVLFKQIIENPKTGIINITGILFTICLCFISVFFVVKKYNKSYEL